jgi:phosphatidate cytidylyltransferase
MLIHRLLAALGLVVLFALALCADYYWLQDSLLLHSLVLVGTYFWSREFWPLCRAAGHQTFSTWGTLSACGLVAAHYWSLHLRPFYEARLVLDCAMVIAIFGVFLLSASRRQFPATLGGLGVTCLGLLYLWFLPSFFLKVRHLGQDGLTNGAGWNLFGAKMVIATVVIAKGCDVWAYLVGRWVGRRKAFPLLSPGKTVEGVIAGLVGSALVALFLHWGPVGVLPAPQFGRGTSVILGLALGFSGMMGDLGESLLKRSAGVKDASAMLPGFGGLLDVVDSLMIAGPVAYFLIPVMLP